MKSAAREKKKRITRVTAAATLTAVITIALGTVYNAGAKEITITEIDEFAGINESRTVRTRNDIVGDVLEEHGVDIGEADKLNLPAEQEVKDSEDIVIKRGKLVKIKVGDHERTVSVTKADVKDALVEAGYIPGEYDCINSSGDVISEGETIELVSVSFEQEIIQEKIERGVEYTDDPALPEGEERVEDEGCDGIREVVVKVTYRRGGEESRETISEEVTAEPRSKVIARGTAQAAKNSSAADSGDGGVVDGYRYKKKIMMTATAYSTSPSENGGYSVSAMGNPLSYGIAAVDPSIVPLGSKLYVTSADGSWTYGTASAEDTGGAIKGNRIDLCYGSDASGFGRKSCIVYILE